MTRPSNLRRSVPLRWLSFPLVVASSGRLESRDRARPDARAKAKAGLDRRQPALRGVSVLGGR